MKRGAGIFETLRDLLRKYARLENRNLGQVDVLLERRVNLLDCPFTVLEPPASRSIVRRVALEALEVNAEVPILGVVTT
jgi:hypothetical protein